MLRKCVRFTLFAYCEAAGEVPSFLEQNLFSILNGLQEFCENNSIEWFLNCEGRRRDTAKDQKNAVYPVKISWHFISSEETLNTIMELFDDAEPVNYTTYLLDVH